MAGQVGLPHVTAYPVRTGVRCKRKAGRMKRNLCLFVLVVVVMGALAFAQEKPKQVMPQLIVTARYVYVTSYDGPPWAPDVLWEDRQAIADVENAIRDWGKYIVVMRPEDADLIILVQRRGSEDVFAVYDRRLGATTPPLWREMRRGGLDSGELPLFSDFRNAVEAAEQKGTPEKR